MREVVRETENTTIRTNILIFLLIGNLFFFTQHQLLIGALWKIYKMQDTFPMESICLISVRLTKMHKIYDYLMKYGNRLFLMYI